MWQDLFDDDLINPISDNEYVVKGSEISSTVINRGKLDLDSGMKMSSFKIFELKIGKTQPKAKMFIPLYI